MKKIVLTLTIVLCALSLRGANPIEVRPSANNHGPENGSLVIIGGGIVPPEIWSRFTELAGGTGNARIVVVTNASGGEAALYEKALASLQELVGRERITLLELSTIAEANDPEKVRPIKEATGVYFTGGRQWRIADVYLNTLAHSEFLNVLQRGGVIAGSSAGASIQGSLLWRGDTSGYDVLIGDHTQGLGFLRNSVIDQHVLIRNRQFHLAGLLQFAPKYIGFGLDESTAAVVTGDVLEVVGKSFVAVYGKSDDPFFFLRPGQRYDLGRYEVIRSENNN